MRTAGTPKARAKQSPPKHCTSSRSIGVISVEISDPALMLEGSRGEQEWAEVSRSELK